MRLPKLDVLLPTLFVGVIFPVAAGGWWRYFSGHADEIGSPMVKVEQSARVDAKSPEVPRQIAVRRASLTVTPASVEPAHSGNAVAVPAMALESGASLDTDAFTAEASYGLDGLIHWH
jgi:hypothetical protein